MNAAGITILLTTHYLDEAEELCDRIAIIDHGKVIACDTTAALVQQVDDKTLTVLLTEPIPVLPAALMRLGLSLAAPGRLLFRYGPSRTELGTLFTAIKDAGFTIRDVVTQETDLEEVFLRLTRSDKKAP